MAASSHKPQPNLPVPAIAQKQFDYQLGSEAQILTFPAGNAVLTQPTPVFATADTGTALTTSGFTNASWDATKGVKIDITQSGIATIGFGSYISQAYTGPEAAYLYNVEILDQNNNVIALETFDGWSSTNTFEWNGGLEEALGNYSADLNWEVWSDNDPSVDTSGSVSPGDNGIYGDAFSTKISGDDTGIVYPLDVDGPFSVLIATQVNIPNGV